MERKIVKLEELKKIDKERFIKDNQRAFNYGALEEFGPRDSHYEEDGEIISAETIENSIDEGKAYWIVCDEKVVGGAVVKIKENTGELELLFINPSEHTKGIGQKAWFAIEERYPWVKRWETYTPYFETRNIHFYVNKCGFRIEEYFNEFHPCSQKNIQDAYGEKGTSEMLDGMFRFVKIIDAKER